MNAIGLFMLITVTAGGNVGHSDGFKSLHDCQEAKSLAMTGETLEQYAAADAKADADRKADALKESRDSHSGRVIWFTGPEVTMSGSEWVATIHGRLVVRGPGDVKTAECVIRAEP